jgi:hypothetical protein
MHAVGRHEIGTIRGIGSYWYADFAIQRETSRRRNFNGSHLRLRASDGRATGSSVRPDYYYYYYYYQVLRGL